MRKIVKRKGSHIIIQSQVANHFVGEDGQLVGKFSHRVVVFSGSKKKDILKEHSDLENQFYNLKYEEKQNGIEKANDNFPARECKFFDI